MVWIISQGQGHGPPILEDGQGGLGVAQQPSCPTECGSIYLLYGPVRVRDTRQRPCHIVRVSWAVGGRSSTQGESWVN